jgi:hypothetical protein
MLAADVALHTPGGTWAPPIVVDRFLFERRFLELLVPLVERFVLLQHDRR